MDADQLMIHLKDIRFGYTPDRLVFNKLDFSIHAGAKIGLAGTNGSGKTTLFHLIMGLLKPSSGQVIVFGRERETEDEFREVRRKIGFLFQDSNDQLFSPTVAEDIAFGPLNLGKTHEESRQIVGETLAMVGLSGYESRITYQLSGGEKRLVALATILAMRPEMLLLDEPFAGLDETSIARVTEALVKSGVGYVLISQRLHELHGLIEEKMHLNDGVIRRL